MYFHQRISLIAVIPLFTGCALHHTAGGSGIEIIHGGSAVAGPVGSPVAVAEERLQTSCLSVLSQPLSKQLEQQVLNECTLPSRRLRALFPFMRYVERRDSLFISADRRVLQVLDLFRDSTGFSVEPDAAHLAEVRQLLLSDCDNKLLMSDCRLATMQAVLIARSNPASMESECSEIAALLVLGVAVKQRCEDVAFRYFSALIREPSNSVSGDPRRHWKHDRLTMLLARDDSLRPAGQASYQQTPPIPVPAETLATHGPASSGTPEPSTPVADIFEQEFEKLRYGRARPVAPTRMQVGVADTVILRISKDTTAYLTSTSNTIYSKALPIKVSTLMEASLSGEGFRITPLVPGDSQNRQIVSNDTTGVRQSQLHGG
jgi:hypothetical protein